MFRNKILYFLVTLECALLCILYEEYAPVMMLWLCVTLAIAMFLCSVVIKHSQEYKFVNPIIMVERDEVCTIEFCIHNKGIIPTGLVSFQCETDGGVRSFSTVIKAGASVNIRIEHLFLYCGVYDVTIRKVKTFDYIKLFSGNRKIDLSARIFVLPKQYLVEEEVSANENDLSLIKELREFVPGDRLSCVHWKISSKCNKLMVKEFDRPLLEEFTIHLGANPVDEHLDAVYSVAMFLVEKECRISINGVSCINSEEVIMTLLSTISEVKSAVVIEENSNTLVLAGSDDKNVSGIIERIINEQISEVYI